jgi:CMP-N,N'-diacetyllegionaminic acid synthase
MKILAIIPARGGSKGLPGKNLRLLAGKPLIAWSIEQAKACPEVDCTFLSTDAEDIAAEGKARGAEVPFLRPAELALDSSPTEPVLVHVVKRLAEQGRHFDAVLLLQPTSPVRRPNSLSAAIAQFAASGADSLLGVVEDHHFFWRDLADPKALYDYQNRPRRQDIAAQDRRYRETGSLYITRTETLLLTANRLGGKIEMFLQSEEEGWEIDSQADFDICEQLLKGTR